MNRRFFRPALATSLAILAGSIAQAQTLTFSGSADSNWQNGANWGGTAPGFNATLNELRLNINGGAVPLIYSEAEGSTIMDISPVGGVDRAIVIGASTDAASGIFNVTGGSLTIVKQPSQNVALLVGAGLSGSWNGNAALDVSGGAIDVGNGEINILGRGTAASTATLTISGTGVVSADLVTFAGLSTTAGIGAINLNTGGALRTRAILDRNVAANTTLNFDGGTLVSLDTDNTEEWVRDDNGGVAVNILTNGAMFDTNGQNNQRITATMAGVGAITKIGAGSMILAANNSYGGATDVSEGTLQIGDNGTTGTIGAGALNLAAGTTLAISRSDVLLQSTFAGGGITAGLGGDVGFEARGLGAFTLDEPNTYTGTTTARLNGHLRVAHGNALGTVGGATIVEGSGADLEVDGNGGSLQLTGGVTIANEPLVIRGTGGSSTGLTAQRGALQSVSGDNTWGGPITIGGNFTRIGVQDGASLTLTGVISDEGNNRTVIFRGGTTTAGMITIATAMTEWGQTNVYGSTTRIGVNDALPINASLFVGTVGVGTSTFDLNGFNQRVSGLSQQPFSTGIITNNGVTDSTLTLDGIVDLSFAGSLTDGPLGTLALVKGGAFVQTFTGASTHTGTTTINDGTLFVTGSIAGGPIVVEGGTISGSSTGLGTGTLGDVTVNAGGNIAAGMGIGHLITGSLSLSSGANFALELDSNFTTVDSIEVNGDLSLALAGSPNLLLTDFGSTVLAAETALPFLTYAGPYNGGAFAVNGVPIADDLDTFPLGVNQFRIDYDYLGSTVALVAVPEPASGVVIAVSLVGVLGLRRRRSAD